MNCKPEATKYIRNKGIGNIEEFILYTKPSVSLYPYFLISLATNDLEEVITIIVINLNLAPPDLLK